MLRPSRGPLRGGCGRREGVLGGGGDSGQRGGDADGAVGKVARGGAGVP